MKSICIFLFLLLPHIVVAIVFNYRTLEKLPIIFCHVLIHEKPPFNRNLLSDIVTSYAKYAEENNTDKICLVNSSFTAKNTPEKYFQTHEPQETDWE